MLVIFATGFINLDKMNKKCILLLVLLMLVTLGSYAQGRPDSTFIGKIYNDELKVYIVMNLVEKNVTSSEMWMDTWAVLVLNMCGPSSPLR